MSLTLLAFLLSCQSLREYSGRERSSNLAGIPSPPGVLSPEATSESLVKRDEEEFLGDGLALPNTSVS
jgi:hypothetical protein